MKNIIRSFVMVSCLLLSSGVAKNYKPQIRPFAKTYIEKNQLSLEESSWWVELDEKSVSPVAIYSDDEGMYFDAVTLSRWTCWRCFWIRNPDEAQFCNQCGNAKP